ncbi:hypothetical protein TNCV_3165611 [Trichonephila clavipes]|nr:hypothetical protein TNCV_3165611 [Trichonephila clavipes]
MLLMRNDTQQTDSPSQMLSINDMFKSPVRTLKLSFLTPVPTSEDLQWSGVTRGVVARIVGRYSIMMPRSINHMTLIPSGIGPLSPPSPGKFPELEDPGAFCLL